MPAEAERQRREHAVEGREHRVLGDDGDVLLALVALLCRIVGRPALRAAAIASRLRASTRMRNSESVLNIACADATGTIASSSMFDAQRRCRSGASTPITRKRRSPTRTPLPERGLAPNSSRAQLRADARRPARRGSRSSRGRKRPCAIVEMPHVDAARRWCRRPAPRAGARRRQSPTVPSSAARRLRPRGDALQRAARRRASGRAACGRRSWPG